MEIIQKLLAIVLNLQFFTFIFTFILFLSPFIPKL